MTKRPYEQKYDVILHTLVHIIRMLYSAAQSFNVNNIPADSLH